MGEKEHGRATRCWRTSKGMSGTGLKVETTICALIPTDPPSNVFQLTRHHL